MLFLGEALVEDLAAAAEPWLDLAEGSVRDTLVGVLGVFRRHAEAVGAITEASTYDPEVAEFWRGFHERFLPGAEQRVRAGNPELGRADAEARAYSLVWMTEVALTQHVRRPTVEEDALIEQLAFLWAAATGS